MARPKKAKPNHGQLYEIKRTIGHDPETGEAVRKSFYSDASKADAERKYEKYMELLRLSLQTGLPFETLEEADAAGRPEVVERLLEAKNQGKKLFSEWMMEYGETYLKPNVSKNTWNYSYKNNIVKHINPYFEKDAVDEITQIKVQRFFNDKAYLSKSVLSKLHMLLFGAFDTAVDNGLCRVNPAKKVKVKSTAVKKPKRAFTEREMKIALEYFEEEFPDVVIALESGARPGELVGFMWTDFDFCEMTYSINRSIAKNSEGGGVTINPPKKDSYRTNPMTQRMARVLKSIPRTSIYVFPGPQGGPQNPNTWAQKFERKMEAAHREVGLPILTPYELRHTFATHLKRMGVDRYIIQLLMGHSSVDVSEKHYIHLDIEDIRKAISGEKSSKVS